MTEQEQIDTLEKQVSELDTRLTVAETKIKFLMDELRDVRELMRQQNQMHYRDIRELRQAQNERWL